MIDLAGKTVLITGSTSGIGLDIAQKFAKAGATIFLNGLLDGISETDLLSRLPSHGENHQFFSADLAKPAEIETMMKNALALSSIDILINNAGIQYVAKVHEFPPEKWQAIIDINLNAAFHTTRLILPRMLKTGWGRIINIASAHGLVASPMKSAYVAAKHGMVGMTKSVALEVAEHNITVNALCPGYVKTALVEKQIPDTAKLRNMSEKDVIEQVMLRQQATKKFVGVHEISAFCLFLCSPEASSITGSALSIDGGWSAQ